MRKIKEIHIRWIGIPIISFIMTFVINDDVHQVMSFWEEFFVSLIFTAILWNGVFMIIKWMRVKYKEIDQTAKRLLFTSLYSTILLIFGSNLIGLCLGLCSLDNIFNPKFFFRHAHINMITSFMIASLYEASYFFNKWKESVIQNQELKNQQIRTQYGVLQNQMSPHFLFNSLNTLTTLITEDQKIAIDFTQTLSEVYRYILQNRERELVQLDEELEFSQAYVFLLKKRYPENLHVYFEVPKDKNKLFIAPLTIQMLVENAIKHNIVSKMSPLFVKIYVGENNQIIVRNNLQIKKSLEQSTKMGIENIRKRYAMLGNRSIEVLIDNDNYIVQIPLIELISEMDHLKSAV